MKAERGMTFVEFLVVATVIGILLSMLVPARGGLDASRTALAKNDVTQIATAVTAFEIEYGHLPGMGRQVVGGEMLAALVGSNRTMNPRKIVFIEVPPLKNKRGGLYEGTFLDPWGGEYQIAFAEGSEKSVIAGTNNVRVNKRVAVWSDPKLSKVPDWWQFWKSGNTKNHSVTSWE